MKRDTLYIFPNRKIEGANKVGSPIVNNDKSKAIAFGCEYQNKTGSQNKTIAGPTTDSYIDRVYIPKQANMDMIQENLEGILVSKRLCIEKKIKIRKIRRFGTHWPVDIQFLSGDPNSS